MSNQSLKSQFLNLAVIVAALGYFVDIYDLLLFTIVREPSLIGINIGDADIMTASMKIINWQMVGLLIGGVLWGVMGDKRGRLSVLFGSILLYSVANFATGYVQTVDQYAWLRFVAGIGLAGELGAGITLVSELMPQKNRGVVTSFVAGVGLFGAVFAYFIYKTTNDWRLCYKIGGVLGIFLLVLRIKVSESAIFKSIESKHVSKGNILMFFNKRSRFKKYILAILIGLPTWFVIGIMLNLSNRFAKDLYGENAIDSGASIMYGYIGIALGDIVVGLVSQHFKSRKKALYIFYAMTILGIVYFFSPLNNNDFSMYAVSLYLGFSTGFWAIFVTMGAEHFGTNLRATAATTIPNVVRGALPLMNLLFKDYFQVNLQWTMLQSAMVTGAIVMVISVVALIFTEETFHKDLDFIEE
ncbi:MAG: MFS transporter [Chitinophagaceae bacterium]|nr:MFS transporter [Chitinophagaceae bacterium]